MKTPKASDKKTAGYNRRFSRMVYAAQCGKEASCSFDSSATPV